MSDHNSTIKHDKVTIVNDDSDSTQEWSQTDVERAVAMCHPANESEEQSWSDWYHRRCRGCSTNKGGAGAVTASKLAKESDNGTSSRKKNASELADEEEAKKKKGRAALMAAFEKGAKYRVGCE